MKLQLQNIKKIYKSGESVVALNGVSLAFRENEFVAVLGPSGCGKTTMLNIIGGLDRYDDGDLIIGGVSTKKFNDSDWDAYRNRSIGFVFQNYNLIEHQTVLKNVEIALTLSGITPAERKERAKQALQSVGLSDQLRKKPNQLSGGQMQRVAIARALVNDPDIILADEPTGALDSKTSVQIMDILKEISETRLVVMVTHNGELAERYATRIVRLLDGGVLSDSDPAQGEEIQKQVKFKKTSMAITAALGLSFTNLLSKRGRTITTAIAGSIGIIGVTLVLALSGGLSVYMDNMQKDTLSAYPITIGTFTQDFDMSSRNPFIRGNRSTTYEEFPSTDTIHNYDSNENRMTHTNVFTDEYLDYLSALPDALPGTVNTITYQHDVAMNLLVETDEGIVRFETRGGDNMTAVSGGGVWQEMPDNEEFILSLYNLIGEESRLPKTQNEIALVIDEYNRLTTNFLTRLGLLDKTYSIDDFLGKTMLRVIDNDDFYTQSGELFRTAMPEDFQALYESGVPLTIVGILRIKEGAPSEYFSQGFVYTTALTDYVLKQAQSSQIAKAQAKSDKDVLRGTGFTSERQKHRRYSNLGADTIPTGISIYPVDFNAKDRIKVYLDDFNTGKEDEQQIVYTDMAETVVTMLETLLNTISLVLIGFAAISLIVSTIMIGIVTYVSVIERTKEIGILRSVGARKKDISRVFNAETLIIGFSAGIIGVVLAYILTFPINRIVERLIDISGIAVVNPFHAVLMISGSIGLTLIAGFIPSRMAAKKDPVEALRS